MSSLPQRKKSAEEIAELRDALGIPIASHGADEPSREGATPLPSATEVRPRTVRSFTPSEPEPAMENQAAATIVKQAVPKIVRSLKKSEQGPINLPTRSAVRDHSKLPSRRRTDQELNEARRREALNTLSPASQPRSMTAHMVVVILGYVLIAASAVGIYFYQIPIEHSGSCLGIALLIAIGIFFLKPYSRHHAAFIAVIAIFVMIFAALYYFPQLRHGT